MILKLLGSKWGKIGGIISLALAVLGLLWGLYSFGYERAEAIGSAALAAERLDRARTDEARALALARAEAAARQKVQEAQARADAYEQDYLAAQAALAREGANFEKRIKNAVQAALLNCAGLPPEWVLEYNKALTGTGAAPMPQDAGAPLPPDSPGAVAATGPGLSGGPLADPADILRHARDYGQACQRYRLQVEGWQRSYKNWQAAND